LFQPSVLMCLLELSEDFKKEYDLDMTNETLLPDFINSIIKKDQIELHLIKSQGDWNGVTFKSDIEEIKKELKKKNLKKGTDKKAL
jgi:hypothetical protein